MPADYSLISLQGLAKPVTTFIEKISGAIGTLYAPTHTREMARAEADAERTKALSRLAVSELEERAAKRMLEEESRRLTNIEAITAQAARQIDDNAEPERMDDDWISNLFKHCKDVSDEEMQTLWSRILASEANQPGSFSRQTLNLLPNLDRNDAFAFTDLCTFVWKDIGDSMLPIILNAEDSVFRNGGNFTNLLLLQELGLITYSTSGYRRYNLSDNFMLFYYDQPVLLDLKAKEKKEISTGQVLFTRPGRELAKICNPSPSSAYFEHMISLWAEQGLNPQRLATSRS